MAGKRVAGKMASTGPKKERVPKVSRPRRSGAGKQAPESSKTSKSGILTTVKKALSKSLSPKKAPVTKKPVVTVLGAKKKPVTKRPVVRRVPRKPVLPPIDVRGHSRVPKHEKLSDTEKAELFERLQVTLKGMPRISPADPAIKHLEPKIGDVIKITRNSYTAGTAVYYRVVSHV